MTTITLQKNCCDCSNVPTDPCDTCGNTGVCCTGGGAPTGSGNNQNLESYANPGSCTTSTEAACTSSSGEYQGDGTSCLSNLNTCWSCYVWWHTTKAATGSTIASLATNSTATQAANSAVYRFGLKTPSGSYVNTSTSPRTPVKVELDELGSIGNTLDIDIRECGASTWSNGGWISCPGNSGGCSVQMLNPGGTDYLELNKWYDVRMTVAAINPPSPNTDQHTLTVSTAYP